MLQRAILAGLATAAVVAAFAFPAPQPAAADDYPSHPITMIVPYPPGGGVDFMGRLRRAKSFGFARPAGRRRKSRPAPAA